MNLKHLLKSCARKTWNMSAESVIKDFIAKIHWTITITGNMEEWAVPLSELCANYAMSLMQTPVDWRNIWRYSIKKMPTWYQEIIKILRFNVLCATKSFLETSFWLITLGMNIKNKKIRIPTALYAMLTSQIIGNWSLTSITITAARKSPMLCV